MEYSSYRLRRQILAEPRLRAFAAEFLLIVEYVDWNTGVKKFTSKAHFKNWCKMLAEANGYGEFEVSEGNIISGGEYVENIVASMVGLDYATLDRQTGTLTLMQQSDWGDEE